MRAAAVDLSTHLGSALEGEQVRAGATDEVLHVGVRPQDVAMAIRHGNACGGEDEVQSVRHVTEIDRVIALARQFHDRVRSPERQDHIGIVALAADHGGIAARERVIVIIPINVVMPGAGAAHQVLHVDDRPADCRGGLAGKVNVHVAAVGLVIQAVHSRTAVDGTGQEGRGRPAQEAEHIRTAVPVQVVADQAVD